MDQNKDIDELAQALQTAVDSDTAEAGEAGILWQAGRDAYRIQAPDPADFDFDHRPIEHMIPRVAAFERPTGKQRKASVLTALAAAAVLLVVLLIQGPANPVRQLTKGNVYITKSAEVLGAKAANQVFVKQGKLFWFKTKAGKTVVQNEGTAEAWLKLPQKVKLAVRHKYLQIDVTGTEFQLKLGEFGGEVLLREGSLRIVHPAGNSFSVDAQRHIRFDKDGVEIIEPKSKAWPKELWQETWPQLAPGTEVILKDASSILPEELPATVLPPAAFKDESTPKTEAGEPPPQKEQPESPPQEIKTPVLKESKTDPKVKKTFGEGSLFRFELLEVQDGDKVIYGTVKKMSGSSWMIETIDGEITYIEKSNLASWKKVQ